MATKTKAKGKSARTPAAKAAKPAKKAASTRAASKAAAAPKAGGRKARAGAKKAAGKSGGAGIEFNHAMIYVTDIPRALEFYRDLLDFRVVDTYPGAYARLISPRGGTSIALHVAGKESSFNPKTEGMRLYFEVERLDAFCKKLEDQGQVIDEPPKLMPWGWRHAYLRDPDGHEVSLYWAGKKRFEATKM